MRAGVVTLWAHVRGAWGSPARQGQVGQLGVPNKSLEARKGRAIEGPRLFGLFYPNLLPHPTPRRPAPGITAGAPGRFNPGRLTGLNRHPLGTGARHSRNGPEAIDPAQAASDTCDWVHLLGAARSYPQIAVAVRGRSHPLQCYRPEGGGAFFGSQRSPSSPT